MQEEDIRKFQQLRPCVAAAASLRHGRGPQLHTPNRRISGARRFFRGWKRRFAVGEARSPVGVGCRKGGRRGKSGGGGFVFCGQTKPVREPRGFPESFGGLGRAAYLNAVACVGSSNTSQIFSNRAITVLAAHSRSRRVH